jgi:hypothetical protein
MSTLAIYLTNRITGAVWNSIPSDVRVGIAGSILGGMIGPFILPWFIPSTVPMAGGACLGVLVNRNIHQVQQVGKAPLCQRFRSMITNAGSYLVRSVESLYHYLTNRENQLFDEDGINNNSTPSPHLPPLPTNYFSNLEKSLIQKSQDLDPTQTELAKERDRRDKADRANAIAWMGNPQKYIEKIGDNEEVRYRSNEPKLERRVIEEYDDTFEITTYTSQVREASSAVWTTTHVSLVKPVG